MAVNQIWIFWLCQVLVIFPFFFKHGICTVLHVFLLKKYKQLQRLHAYTRKTPKDTHQSLQQYKVGNIYWKSNISHF